MKIFLVIGGMLFMGGGLTLVIMGACAMLMALGFIE